MASMAASLSPTDRARIREAVARAERHTAGEIVPFIVARSGRYEVAVWRGACVAAALALAGVLILLRLHTGWGLAWLYDVRGPALLMLAAGALGGLVTAFVSRLRRRLAGAARIDRAVRQRATRAFVEEEVFATRGRTGILLFVSLFERRIEVLADAGIHRRVEAGAWQGVVATIHAGMVDGRLGDGLVEAIERCGALLERAGVDIGPDDPNELGDEARVRDEE
jgi:putative membrane protein